MSDRVYEKEDLGESIRAAFAKPVGEQALVPMGGAQVSVTDAVITAQKVAVERDEGKVLGKIRTLAHAVGEEFYYRFPVKSRGQTNWIEGPSIKCANNVARLYGNCQVDTRVVDNGDSWIIYAKFVDYETGFSYTRPFQQRKNQGSIRGDADRQLDIALQIGISKAIRNVICNALETFTNYAFEEAKSAIVAKVGKNLDAYRDRVIGRLTDMRVDLNRVETAIGRAHRDWLAPDVARIITQLQAINDGMATIDETWPDGGSKEAPPRPTRDQFTEAQTEPAIWIIADHAGNEREIHGSADFAAAAYRSTLDVAERQGDAALGTAIDNNGPFFTQLDELGHTDLSRELSLEGGKRREAARAREQNVPRGTENPEVRGNVPAADGPGTDADASLPSDAEASAQGDMLPSGAGAATRKDPVIPDTANAPGERDPKFWRKNGTRTLLADTIDGFMGELPHRLAECRTFSDADDIERQNAIMIRKLDMADRSEVASLFARRRDELRAQE